MVDFAKLNADRYEAASPQERVRIDTAKANAEIEDAATRPLRARTAETKAEEAGR